METEFKTAEIYNSNIGHNLASLHCFLTEKIELLSQVHFFFLFLLTCIEKRPRLQTGKFFYTTICRSSGNVYRDVAVVGLPQYCRV